MKAFGREVLEKVTRLSDSEQVTLSADARYFLWVPRVKSLTYRHRVLADGAWSETVLTPAQAKDLCGGRAPSLGTWHTLAPLIWVVLGIALFPIVGWLVVVAIWILSGAS